MPKISVIMPAYNAEKYIGEAIDSILSQTFRDFELIVLNDCSRDGTESVISSYDDPRIVYVKNEENLGVARTLNKGLALARGEYIARMDADDISLRSRFENQAAYLDANPQVAAVGANAEVFGESGVLRYSQVPCSPEEVRLGMALSNPFIHPAVMMRAAPKPQYDPAFEGREDYRLWMVLSEKWQLANLPQVLLRYRIHSAQVTQNQGDARAKKHMLLKETYYRELNAGLTEEMIGALCHATYSGKTDVPQLLEQSLRRLAAHYGCEGLPRVYAQFLLSAGREKLTAGERWRLSGGLSWKQRLAAILPGSNR